MKRAPVWFTHGKTRERIHTYWPWLAGAAVGAMYWYQPEPFEQVRTAGLYAVRRPVLQSTQWLEVRDVDPESMALDLPPDQIFGPLPLKQQVEFIMQALNEDNELADGYITRLVIDHMDLSLDPPFLGDVFVEAGAAQIMRFAVKDYLEEREGAKHRFFDADRFLRFINICANHDQLASELVDTHDGVNLLFKAMSEATNEYARVLGMRAVTLCAFQQAKDGDVEKRIVDGGYLPRMVNFYRQSTGDPTDTRFVTLLFSSILRMYPKEVYDAAIEANLIKTTVNNLNIARYKGVPQHIRILQDLEKARVAAKGESAADAVTEATRKTAEARSKKGWFGFIGNKPATEEDAKKMQQGASSSSSSEQQADEEGAATPQPGDDLKDLTRTGAVSRRGPRVKGVQEVTWESHRENPNELPPMPPPKNPNAPVGELLVESDFVPVALGICDVFPEYFESSRELIHLLRSLKPYITPFDLFELRFLAVASKLWNRHGEDRDFEEHGVAAALEDLTQWIMNDPECKPYLSMTSKATNAEIKTSIKAMQTNLERRAQRLQEGEKPLPRNDPIPVA